MSPAVETLIAGIAAGTVTPANANSAIQQAGGEMFVILEVIRALAAGGGGSTDVAGDIHAAASKTTPVNADEFALADSADGYSLKKLTLENLKAAFGTAALAGLDTDTALSANSDARVPSQAAVVAFVTTLIGSPLRLEATTLNASTNPNWPSASAGYCKFVSVAGKVGGASGRDVSVGDMIVALSSNAGGTEASVGASWFILECNIPGITAQGLNILTSASAGVQRAYLGLQIGSDVAAYNAEREKMGVHGAAIASATTTNLETATGQLVDVTGTTAITGITLSEGHCRVVRFTGILTLTHGSSLVLPTGANITTAPGDCTIFAGYAAGVVRCFSYQRANGTPLAGGGGGSSISDPKVYYVRTGGSDVTKEAGNPAKPYETASQAIADGEASGASYVLDLGVGTFHVDLTSSTNYLRSILGKGFNPTRADSLTILEISSSSPNVSNMDGANAFGFNGVVHTSGVFLDITANGGQVTAIGDAATYAAGSGGSFIFVGSAAITASLIGGGTGPSSEVGTVNAGSGGNIKLTGNFILAQDGAIVLTGGTNYPSMSPGTKGIGTFLKCDLSLGPVTDGESSFFGGCIFSSSYPMPGTDLGGNASGLML